MESPSNVPLPPSPTPTLTVDDVLNFNVDELREQLELRGVSTAGLAKPALQKALLNEVRTTAIEVGEDFYSSAVDNEWRREELAMEMQDRKEAREATRQSEKYKQEAFERLELRKLEAENSLELYKAKEEKDLARAKLEADERDKIRQYDLDKSRIERGIAIPVPTSANDSFKLANAVKFVPKFDDSQMDQYLLAFEKAMLVLNFPKDRWTQLIQTTYRQSFKSFF